MTKEEVDDNIIFALISIFSSMAILYYLVWINLKPNGIFSYWEGASDKFINPKTINALYKDFEIDKIILELNNIPESKEQFEKSHRYYYNPDWKQCVIPIIKHRNTPIKKELI